MSSTNPSRAIDTPVRAPAPAPTPAPARTPDEIRASIEQNRQELGTSLVRLRTEVGYLTDWRAQLRRNKDQLSVAAAAAGFVLAGGIGGAGALLFGRRRRRGQR